MTIWTSKRVLAGLVLLVQTGCADGPSLAFAPTKTADTDRQTEIALAEGRVALRAPAGFCIDPASVSTRGRDGFAMLARCNKINPDTVALALSGQSPAVMTVSTRAWTREGTGISSADIAGAYPEGAVLDTRDTSPMAMVRAKGGAPRINGLSETHWRGAMVINDQLVVMGLYAPQDSRALGTSGAGLLDQLARRTAKASTRPATRPATKPAAKPATTTDANTDAAETSDETTD